MCLGRRRSLPRLATAAFFSLPAIGFARVTTRDRHQRGACQREKLHPIAPTTELGSTEFASTQRVMNRKAARLGLEPRTTEPESAVLPITPSGRMDGGGEVIDVD